MRFALAVFALLLLTGCQAQRAKDPSFTFRYRLAEEPGKPVPVVILLHGYGSDENDLFSLAPRFPFSIHVASLRAPYARAEGGHSWFGFGNITDQKWSYDYQQARASSETIAAFARHMCRQFNGDSTRIFLLGFSQGAIMAYEAAAQNPILFKGVMALSGGMLHETKMAVTENHRTSYFISHGTQDEILGFRWSEEARDHLLHAGADLTFKGFAGGHEIPESCLRELLVWLKAKSR